MEELWCDTGRMHVEGGGEGGGGGGGGGGGESWRHNLIKCQTEMMVHVSVQLLESEWS